MRDNKDRFKQILITIEDHQDGLNKIANASSTLADYNSYF